MISFDLRELRGACEVGLRDARRFLVPTGKNVFTVQEALDAGMPAVWIAWLLSTKVDTEKDAISILVDGTRRVMLDVGLEGNPETADQCLSILNEAAFKVARETIARDCHGRNARSCAFDRIGRAFLGALSDRGLLDLTRKGTEDNAEHRIAS